MNLNKNFINSLLENCHLNIPRYNKYKTFEKNQIPLPHPEIALPKENYKWYFGDNEENFKKNPHPNYLNGFEYKFNNYGYRCDDFDLEKDKYKILTVGCSVSFGLGIPYEETYSYLLCKKLSEKYNLDIKNYNLSHAGMGLDYISRVLFQTIDLIKPNYVVLFFPTNNRLEYINTPIHNHSLYFNDKKKLKKMAEMYLSMLNDESYCFLNFVKNFNFINEVLERRNIKWFWSTWNDNLKKDNIENYINLTNTDCSDVFINSLIEELKNKPMINKTNLARDWTHPGKEFNLFFSNYLYNRIEKENIFKNVK